MIHFLYCLVKAIIRYFVNYIPTGKKLFLEVRLDNSLRYSKQSNTIFYEADDFPNLCFEQHSEYHRVRSLKEESLSYTFLCNEYFF